MRHVTAFGLLPFALLAALPAQAQMITLSPEQIGQIFCISSLGNDMAPVEGLLSEDLGAVVDLAFKQNAEFEAAHPGDKPPLGDGLPWRSYQDYADGCTVGEGVMERESATVAINYTFSDYPDADYSNELRLLPAHFIDGEPPIWRIDDIGLGDGLTFREAIAGAFAAQ